MALFQIVSVDSLYNLNVSMFRNKKHMAWNFHLFSNIVSICLEMFRNVSNSDLVIFGSVSICFSRFTILSMCFNVSQQEIYGLGFSPFLQPCFNLLRNVSKRFKFGLSHF